MTDEEVEKLENMLTLEWMLSNHDHTERMIKPKCDIVWTETVLVIFYGGHDHLFVLPTRMTEITHPWRGNLTASMKVLFDEFIRVMEL